MADWRMDRDQVLAALRDLIDLWDSRAGLGWNVSSDRHGVNVAMINAYTSHAVNLARAVIDLHLTGRTFESVSLVRSSMECAVTATWLALYPEKTPDLLKFSATERKKLLTDIVKFGGGSAPEAIAEVEQIESIEGHTDPEGKWLKSRFYSLKGGDSLYVTYRALCALDHAGNSLADAYTERVEQSEENPWGVVLRDHPDDALGVTWLGIEASLILQAQIAADSILSKPRRKTQLSKWAKKIGVAASIGRSE
ncbi:hypothetical protein BH10ACT7_BH10ACT7_05530 [soil metagenome]